MPTTPLLGKIFEIDCENLLYRNKSLKLTIKIRENDPLSKSWRRPWNLYKAVNFSSKQPMSFIRECHNPGSQPISYKWLIFINTSTCFYFKHGGIINIANALQVIIKAFARLYE
jgi:hypothetical protein